MHHVHVETRNSFCDNPGVWLTTLTSQNKNKQAELADLLHLSVLANHLAGGGRYRPE